MQVSVSIVYLVINVSCSICCDITSKINKTQKVLKQIGIIGIWNYLFNLQLKISRKISHHFVLIITVTVVERLPLQMVPIDVDLFRRWLLHWQNDEPQTLITLSISANSADVNRFRYWAFIPRKNKNKEADLYLLLFPVFSDSHNTLLIYITQHARRQEMYIRFSW